MPWVESPHEVVQSWLRSTRIVDERPVTDLPLKDVYKAMFDACVKVLELSSEHPLLHVTRTAQAMSETMRLPSGQPIVIYDQYQGRVVSRLNRFMWEEFPDDLVVRFFLRHLRIALFTAGLVPPAAYAGLLLKGWPIGRQRSDEPAPHIDDARLTYTMLQECFVIAHELAHLAIEVGKVDALLWELVDKATHSLSRGTVEQGVAEYLAEEERATATAGLRASLGDEAAAEFTGSDEDNEFDVDGLHAFMAALPARMADEPHLRDEAVCDLLAAVVVLDVVELGPGVVIPALRLALGHHKTLVGVRERTIRDNLPDVAPNGTEQSQLVPSGLRGWIFTEIWKRFIHLRSGDEALNDYMELLHVQQRQHSRRIQGVADWAPMLILHGARTGLFEGTTVTTWPATWVMHDILEEMGSDGISPGELGVSGSFADRPRPSR
jgi:hypothetical protein